MVDGFLLDWTLQQFQVFILILVRVAAIIFMMPVIGAKGVPGLAKAGLCLIVSLVLLPVVQVDPKVFPDDAFSMALLLVKEIFVGFTLGLVLKLVFAGIQLAGQMVGFQMGFGVAHVMDPQMGQESPVLAELGYLVSLLIFLAVDGHHIFFQTLMYSFSILQPGEMNLTEGVYNRILLSSGGMFVIAVKVMAPVMAILLFTQAALGILAKAVPQMNLLIVSFPLTIGIGLFFFGLSMQVMGPFFIRTIHEAGNLLPVLIRGFKG